MLHLSSRRSQVFCSLSLKPRLSLISSSTSKHSRTGPCHLALRGAKLKSHMDALSQLSTFLDELLLMFMLFQSPTHL
jgi:hypothetical protein